MEKPFHIEKLAHIHAHQQSAYAVCASEDGFFTAGGDKAVIQWKWDALESPKIICKTTSAIFSLAYLPQGVLCVGTNEGKIHFVDLALKQEIKCLQLDAAIFCLYYAPELQALLASTANGQFVVIDALTHACREIIKISTEKIRSIAHSPHRQTIALACSDGHVYLLNTNNFQVFQSFQAHEWACNVVQFHPQQPWLLTASKDAHLAVWNLENGKCEKRIPAHNYAIYSVDFHPSGKYFITSGRDKTIKLWDADALSVLTRLNELAPAHTHSVNAQLWNAEQNRLVSVGDDRRVIIWKVEVPTTKTA